MIIFLIQITIAQSNTCPTINENDPCEGLAPWACQALSYFKSWESAAALALVISAVLAALAYMIGTGFEMPDLKAWASNEISQLIATAIIIVVMTGVFVLINEIVVMIVNESRMPGLSCTTLENCLNKTATFYFDEYITTAKEEAKNAYKESIEDFRSITTRYMASCSEVLLPVPCLQTSASAPALDVGKAVLNSERAFVVYEYYQNLLSSMEAQKFFVNNVAYTIGPMILALGILGRTFFFTRRLGGLLIAVAIGIMIVFPAMYIFDWVSMQVTLYGDLPFSAFGSNCPSECKLVPPVAYARYTNGSIVPYYNTQDLANFTYNVLQETTGCTPEQNMLLASELASNLTSGETAEYKTKYSIYDITIISCEAQAQKGKIETPDKNYTCALPCRELPYPYWNQECRNYLVQLACSNYDPNCKIMRLVENIDPNQYNNNCPPECKIIPPLKSNCTSVLRTTSFCPKGVGDGKCIVDACLDSRFDCRSKYRNGSTPFEESLLAQLAGKKDKTSLIALEKCTMALNCAGFKPNLTDYSNPREVAEQSCIYIYPDPANPKCSNCLTLEKAYLYDPPVRLADECKNLCSSKPTGKKQTGTDVELLTEGNVGPTIITNVAKLIVPVYVLPLFNILVTVMFIRSFSRFLGGDIEIPGLAKVL